MLTKRTFKINRNTTKTDEKIKKLQFQTIYYQQTTKTMWISSEPILNLFKNKKINQKSVSYKKHWVSYN